MSARPSAVLHQVMWNRLISVVEEQAQALVRTAFSTSVREAGDLSAGVYDTSGHMLAQAVTGTPGHVNAMAEAVAHFIRRIGREKTTSPMIPGRDPAMVKRDLARGYISAEVAKRDYGLTDQDVEDVLDAIRRGEAG